MNKKNNRYFQNGINGLIVVCGGILFYYILFHNDKLYTLFSKAAKMMTPIIAGFVIAYLLNPIMKFIEDRIIYKIFDRFKKNPGNTVKVKKVVRCCSTFITIILFLLLLYGLIMMVVPQLIVNIQSIIDRVPFYFINLNNYYNGLLKQYPKVEELLNMYWADIYTWFNNNFVPQIEGFISKISTSLLGSIISVFKSLLNFIIGIIIAIYLLVDKEIFLAQIKKVIYAILKDKRANYFLNNIRYTNNIFGGFITGKVVDSFIIGVICYFCLLILKMPYPTLISVIVGVTNIIPYFGPFIGAIPSAFIVLMVNPKKCLIFLIFVLVLQQFDGNILGPKILGQSTGLSSFWVIFSITVFGGIFGVTGMFIGVPVFAVIYAAFKTYILERLAKKNMPIGTSYYISSDIYSEGENRDDYSGKNFRFAKDRKNFEEAFGLNEDQDSDNE